MYIIRQKLIYVGIQKNENINKVVLITACHFIVTPTVAMAKPKTPPSFKTLFRKRKYDCNVTVSPVSDKSSYFLLMLC